jgi:hypothetical protein
MAEDEEEINSHLGYGRYRRHWTSVIVTGGSQNLFVGGLIFNSIGFDEKTLVLFKVITTLNVAKAEYAADPRRQGEAVLRYCEPLTTKEMWHQGRLVQATYTAFPKGKN